MTIRDGCTGLLIGLLACGLLTSCGGEPLGELESFEAGKADITGAPIMSFSPVVTQLLGEVGEPEMEDCTLVRIRPGYPSDLSWQPDGSTAWSPAVINKSGVMVQDGHFYSQADSDRKVRYKLEDAEVFKSKLELMSTEDASAPGQVKMNVDGHLLTLSTRDDWMVAGRALILSRKDPRYMGYTTDSKESSRVYSMDAMVIYLKTHTLQPDPKSKSVISCKRLESLEDLPWQKGGCYWFKAPEKTPYCF